MNNKSLLPGYQTVIEGSSFYECNDNYIEKKIEIREYEYHATKPNILKRIWRYQVLE